MGMSELVRASCPHYQHGWFLCSVQGFSGIMAPKRRAASNVKAGGKKGKQEPETPKPKDAFTSAKEALLAAGPEVKATRKVDEHCSMSGEVRETLTMFIH